MGYFESLDSNLKLEPAPIGVSFSTLEYTHDSFLDKLAKGEFSPTKIKSIIESNVPSYFDYGNFSDIKTRKNIQAIWTNITFLSNVLALLNENEKFRQKLISNYRRDINIITNDYIRAEENPVDSGISIYAKDSKITDILFEIACNINAEYIVQLSSTVDIYTAKLLAMAYFCTFDTPQSVRNIIGTLWNGRTFSIEQIIYIFYVFFKDNFADVFIHAMVFHYSGSSDIEFKTTENNISSALINILNSMSTTEIREVLAKYANYLSFCDVKNLRFSLKHLPEEFKNIAQSVAEAEANGYYIP